MDRNREMRRKRQLLSKVALRKESVDRNCADMGMTMTTAFVALRKESVDRNLDAMKIVIVIVKSLSARRAWIEMIDDLEPSSTRKVALRKESVDRNYKERPGQKARPSRSPQGERG